MYRPNANSVIGSDAVAKSVCVTDKKKQAYLLPKTDNIIDDLKNQGTVATSITTEVHLQPIIPHDCYVI